MAGQRIRDTRMDAGARRWLIATAKKNLWRVAGWIDVDDLVSDGALCWQLVVTRYRHVTDRPQLMRLFQTTYRNHLHQLANRRTLQTELCMDLPDISPDPDAELLLRVREAPLPLRTCLLALLAHPERAARPIRRQQRHRQTTDSWLKGMADVVSDIDVAQQLHEFLRG